MIKIVILAIGLLLGGVVGVIIMSLMQINRTESREEEQIEKKKYSKNSQAKF